MKPPYIGAVVQFTSGMSNPLGDEQEFTVYAAIVTHVYADDSVDLKVFMRESDDWYPAVYFSQAPAGSEYAIGRWTWPQPRLKRESRNATPPPSHDWLAGLPNDPKQETRHGF